MTTAGRRRSAEQRGSVLMLVPAGFLVLMLLAGMTVDSAVTYLGQRQLTDELTAAANDAATAGLDQAAYYQHGTYLLDATAAGRAVCVSMAAQGDLSLKDLQLTMGVAGATIEVRGTAEVEAVFGRLIPHFGTRTVSTDVRATAERAAQAPGAPPATFTPLHC